jgi:cobalt/nickel transport system permease protein
MSDVPLHHWISRRRGFLERTLSDLSFILDRSYAGDPLVFHDRLLQRLDPRVKLGAAILLIVHSASTHSVWVVAAILTGAVMLAIASRLPLVPILRLWLTVGVLAALLAIPAMFMTSGRILWSIPSVGWNVSDSGVNVAARLVLRALASSTIAAVLVLSTSWQYVLKAMRRFGVPVVAVVLIGMSYRYIVLFLQTGIELINARKSRLVGKLPASEGRRLALSSIGVLLEKAFTLGNEVHLAMQARGYRGEVAVLDEFAMARRDWFALSCISAFELMLLMRAWSQ